MDAKTLVEQYQQQGLNRKDIKLRLEQEGFSTAIIDDAMQHLPTIHWDTHESIEPTSKKTPNGFSILTGAIMVAFGIHSMLGSGINSIVGFFFIIAGILNIVYAIKNAK